jgi:hypothetical protein
MTNEQLYVAIGAPMLFNAILFGLLTAFIKAKFDGIHRQFDALDKRFDDTRDQWRSER